jgi:hypothetical protein
MRQRQVPVVQTRRFFVNVTKTRMRTEYQTIARQIPYQQQLPYTVQVPYQVSVMIPVPRCRFVPRTITVPIAGCCPGCLKNYPDLNQCLAAYGHYLTDWIWQAPLDPKP